MPETALGRGERGQRWHGFGFNMTGLGSTWRVGERGIALISVHAPRWQWDVVHTARIFGAAESVAQEVWQP